MKKITSFLLVAACTACIHAAVAVSPSDPHVQSVGRINWTNPERPVFTYPGTRFSLRTSDAGDVLMQAKPGSGYFWIEVDSLPGHKVCFGPSDSVLTIARKLQGVHTITATLCYEGFGKRPELRAFKLTGKHARLLAPLPLTQHKIEFIGNSITCGYGVEAQSQHEHYTDSTENHCLTYAALLCRRLGAQEMCVARSGIGVYRNYNGPATGSWPKTMREWYDMTCLYDSTQQWQFSNYRPDVICVNLGTNDLSTRAYDFGRYKQAYRSFIEHLHTVQPQAQIVMLTGPMVSGEKLEHQKQVLNDLARELRTFGLPVHRFDFTPADGSLGYGADWHPSAAQHRLMAQELEPLMRRLLGL